VEFLPRTFQLCKGVGPWREKDLWARGVAGWADFVARRAAGEELMSRRLDAELALAIDAGAAALNAGDLAALSRLVPAREHWRLYGHFAAQAAFFDIEADGDQVPTVVGVMDAQGLAMFRRDDRSLDALPARLAASPIWVTFNGGTFDVPVLKKTFSEFPAPLVHLDLRFIVRQAKLSGGLKGVERTLGLNRPPHLEGLRGFDAIRLWREWTINRHLEALRILIEYNLYDAINLRSVLEWSAWRIAELSGWSVARRPIFERGDVLYDLSRLVMAV
jgi:uncharacterized protein YprB with RNaseH-like and TPR domain